jgi:hypothetical protein
MRWSLQNDVVERGSNTKANARTIHFFFNTIVYELSLCYSFQMLTSLLCSKINLCPVFTIICSQDIPTLRFMQNRYAQIRQ